MTTPTASPALRAATAADVEQILTVVEAAYRGEGGWTTEAHLVRGSRTHAQEVTGLLESPEATLLVAVDEADAVIGCCYASRTGDRASFGLFAVAPWAQSGGIGSRLLEEQVSLQRDAGAQVMEIEVLESRPELHAWYERHGFVPTGETIPFPGEHSSLRVEGLRMRIMERPLR